MSRAFSLAGLLRLRHSQQEQAAADLATAHASSKDAKARRGAVRIEASMTESEAVSPAALTAIAAARASSRSMLTDLDTLCQLEDEAVATAQSAYMAARTRSVGLEKLSDRHRAEWNAGQLKVEQNALDEIASSRRYRTQGE
jgi:flagellar FliJ protein